MYIFANRSEAEEGLGLRDTHATQLCIRSGLRKLGGGEGALEPSIHADGSVFSLKTELPCSCHACSLVQPASPTPASRAHCITQQGSALLSGLHGPSDPAVSFPRCTHGPRPAWPTPSSSALQRAPQRVGDVWKLGRGRQDTVFPLFSAEQSGRMCGWRAQWGPSWQEQM